MFPIIPIVYFIDLSASYKVTVEGFNSLSSNLLQIDSGIRLILAPRSHKTLSKGSLPITQGIKKKLPRSLSLGGNLFCKIILHSFEKATISNHSSFFLYERISLRNLA